MHLATGLIIKSFAVRVVNAWNSLPEEVFAVGSTSEFKDRLDNVWLSIFGEDRVWVAGPRKWPRGKHVINFSSFRVIEMRLRVTGFTRPP